jgi:hypothetical protein
MGTPLTNKIVTRGFGVARSVPNSSGPVTMGYGPLIPQAIASAFRRPKQGQSGFKRRMAEMDEVIVWAKCVTVNDTEPKKPIQGWIKVMIDKDRDYASVIAEHVSTRIRDAWDTVKITVKRIK